MRKRGLCCGPVSVTFVNAFQTAEDIVKLLCRPVSPINLVFDLQRRYQIPRGLVTFSLKRTTFEIFDL